MKRVNRIILLLSCIGLITSCDLTSDTIDEIDKKQSDAAYIESELFMQENIAILDARVRSVSEEAFVKELIIKNFSDKKWDKTRIGFAGGLFEDTGVGNDLVALDGIYTSVDFFEYDDVVTYDENMDIKSVLNKAIVSPNFMHEKALLNYSSNYEFREQTLKAGGTATLSCKIKVVSTGCIADKIWEGFGCVAISDCSFTIGW